MSTLAAQRDASWYDHPEVRSVKVLHRVVDGWVSACNRRMLLTPTGEWVEESSKSELLCRRRACFPDREASVSVLGADTPEANK